MFYNYYEDYQYDSCISKGICSIGPRTSSLQEVLIMYLKLLTFYTIELQSFGGHNKDAKKIILDTISMLMQNLEYQNEQFEKLLINIKTLIINSKKTYIKLCKDKNIEPKYIKTNIKLDSKINNINTLIKQGEKEFGERNECLSQERKRLLEIMGFVIKSLCINIVELESYSKDEEIANKAFEKLLILLNFLNYTDTKLEDILDAIKLSSKVDHEIFIKIQELKQQRYGDIEETEISQSTRPNKAILVAGCNIRELEDLLENTKDKNIDVYTHGEMIQAHFYPKFTNQYSNLIGHFGMGIENCLLDFANFPGAILITKFATENIEYLYRGRLFTTDYFVPKGAIKINNDYSEIIKSALNAKGFKTGKNKPKIKAGYSANKIETKLEYLNNNIDNIKHIIILSPDNLNQKNRIYYENIIKNIPDDTFLINLGFSINEKPNIVSFNSINDFYLVYLILNEIEKHIQDKDIDLSLFISKCDKHTISNIINLKTMGIKNIYLSKCTPIMLNPTLVNVLNEYYDIKTATDPIDNLKQITN